MDGLPAKRAFRIVVLSVARGKDRCNSQLPFQRHAILYSRHKRMNHKQNETMTNSTWKKTIDLSGTINKLAS